MEGTENNLNKKFLWRALIAVIFLMAGLMAGAYLPIRSNSGILSEELVETDISTEEVLEEFKETEVSWVEFLGHFSPINIIFRYPDSYQMTTYDQYLDGYRIWLKERSTYNIESWAGHPGLGTLLIEVVNKKTCDIENYCESVEVWYNRGYDHVSSREDDKLGSINTGERTFYIRKNYGSEIGAPNYAYAADLRGDYMVIITDFGSSEDDQSPWIEGVLDSLRYVGI